MVNSQDRITATFAALADPTRRRILDRLSKRGEGPVTALAKPFRISPPAISRHLRVLERASLIHRRRDGRVHLIRFRPAGLQRAQTWMAHFAAGLDFSFDKLDQLLAKEHKWRPVMKSAVNISGNRLQVTRTFHAPRAQVFRWWTTAEKLEQWSGCKECVKSEIVMDFRVGGSFTQKMKLAVQGGIHDYSLAGTYLEIVEPEKIVYQADFGNASTLVTVQFLEHGKTTEVILTHDGCPDQFFCENVSQGTADSLEKLDLLLSQALATSL